MTAPLDLVYSTLPCGGRLRSRPREILGPHQRDVPSSPFDSIHGQLPMQAYHTYYSKAQQVRKKCNSPRISIESRETNPRLCIILTRALRIFKGRKLNPTDNAIDAHLTAYTVDSSQILIEVQVFCRPIPIFCQQRRMHKTTTVHS